ncbi:MAG: hypothetical protein K9G57_14835, partial [Ignavibacteriales bacterium]|nr:hypothetical protein [Ignavibacteriales bacterium]
SFNHMNHGSDFSGDCFTPEKWGSVYPMTLLWGYGVSCLCHRPALRDEAKRYLFALIFYNNVTPSGFVSSFRINAIIMSLLRGSCHLFALIFYNNVTPSGFFILLIQNIFYLRESW